ncbi:DNA polymerase, beta domain protein region [Thermosinus carboxydivorans Nor1]|uniref:DNA polymerase, beta domain protein region n=1 Tax=Thermosinus carboxydivorans Nor1 TaxID=401526 RepID=A1HMA8_9FIRM|nr:nucleotidyltransferase domain-containing protein [Thermosinus carboxydivorans]EAX48953.1 DNA polymerase, beta domain protein region [Thermosinus carboxydivorans Nor1]
MAGHSVERVGACEVRGKILPLCQARPAIAAVFLFGSYGTDYQTRFSDIDLGVLFFPDGIPNLRGEMELAGAFSSALGRDDVDLVIMNKAPLPLRYRIVAEGEIVYEKDYVYTSDFLAATYKYFLDYNIDYRMFMAEYSRSLKEAYKANG